MVLSLQSEMPVEQIDRSFFRWTISYRPSLHLLSLRWFFMPARTCLMGTFFAPERHLGMTQNAGHEKRIARLEGAKGEALCLAAKRIVKKHFSVFFLQ